MSKNSRRKSLAKTAIYRMWAIALLAALTYYFTGDAGEATTITILFNVGGTLAYYGLERLWESVDWRMGTLGHLSAVADVNDSIKDVEAT